MHRSGPAYIPRVSLSDYDYDLPPGRIAEFPLTERDRSRLLLCDAGSGTIEHHIFRDLPSLIPSGAMLVVNSTRVVRARIIMQRESGGRVEIFLLEPREPSRDPAVALTAKGEALWSCMVGGAKKFIKEGELKGEFSGDGARITMTASIAGESEDGFLIRFRWEPADMSFAELLELAGRIPLPPYIKRDATDADAATYQTIYAHEEGAVAAPTAGLHFTPEVLDALRAKGVAIEHLTLHVGAGTFRQVKGEVEEHEMHQERIAVSTATLRRLIEHARRRRDSGNAPFVMVGTTSVRTLESLYWFGARVMAGEAEGEEMMVEQWDPYRLAAGEGKLPDLVTSLEAVERWRASRGLDAVTGRTGIIIVPGYTFRACDGLITNFHQPGSTLILLVGALLGRDLWRRVYDEALARGYRFLSYGDASLLWGDGMEHGG